MSDFTLLSATVPLYVWTVHLRSTPNRPPTVKHVIAHDVAGAVHGAVEATPGPTQADGVVWLERGDQVDAVVHQGETP